MNDEAKQMMLLASIDGVIADLPNMMMVNNGREATCLRIDNRVALYGARLDVHEYIVELKPFGFNGDRVGAIGRCSCGKIYYTLKLEGTMWVIE